MAETRKKSSSKKSKKARRTQRLVGLAMTLVLFVAMLVFFILLATLNILPTIYMVVIGIVLLIILFYVFASQLTKAHMVGKVMAVIVFILLCLGSYYVSVTSGVFHKITNMGEETNTMSIVVLSSAKAEYINQTGDYIYGINNSSSYDAAREAISMINEKLSGEVMVVEAENWNQLVQELYDGTIQAMILDEGYRSSIIDYYPTFDTDTRVVDEYLEVDAKTETVTASDKAVTEEAFIVLISGTDTEGKLSSVGRSDVNILATVNPDTHEVFLVTTPRDAYVSLYNDESDTVIKKDKLTHASNNGLACSVATLEHLYDVDIDFYIRMNFTGLEKLVDALGGIRVWSDYAFTSYAQTHTYKEGWNDLDGYAALIFARERHAFSAGDFQRNKNQVYVIQAIAEKALSVSILNKYTDVLNTLTGVVATNVPQEQLSKLVKMEIDDLTQGNGDWEFKSYSVAGTTGMEGDMSVVYLDEAQVALAKKKINAALAGQDPDSITE